MLIQCGPNFTPSERDVLAAFLRLLPTDLQFAIEFRQRVWITREWLLSQVRTMHGFANNRFLGTVRPRYACCSNASACRQWPRGSSVSQPRCFSTRHTDGKKLALERFRVVH